MLRNKENQPMSEWLKEDAVRLDLPDEEIIIALCEEIEKKNNIIEEQRESDIAIGKHMRLISLTYKNAEHIGFILDKLEENKTLTEE